VEVPSSGGSTQGSNTGGLAEQAVNTIACGTPDASGAFVVSTLVRFFTLRMRLRTHRASGVPRALSTEGGTFTAHLGRIRVARSRNCIRIAAAVWHSNPNHQNDIASMSYKGRGSDASPGLSSVARMKHREIRGLQPSEIAAIPGGAIKGW